MSFDEVRFPLTLRAGSLGGPTFLTDVVTIQGGYERRNQCWSQPRRKYAVNVGAITASDAAQLMAFFAARAGRARGFRLRDWDDYSSAPDHTSAPSWSDQVIGTGNGVTTQFALTKTYGAGSAAWVREIKKPEAGSVTLGVAGVQYETGWSVDTTSGVVTFAQPPATGSVITAGFLFDVPVRFDTDKLSVNAQNKAIRDTDIPLIEVRVP